VGFRLSGSIATRVQWVHLKHFKQRDG